MSPMEAQQAPQSAEREAEVNSLCASTKAEAELTEVNNLLMGARSSVRAQAVNGTRPVLVSRPPLVPRLPRTISAF